MNRRILKPPESMWIILGFVAIIAVLIGLALYGYLTGAWEHAN